MVWNKCRAEFWTNYHAFFCNQFRILTASILLAHFFWFLPRDFNKLIQNGMFLIPSAFLIPCCQFMWVFWSPWAKIKKSEPIRWKQWEFWINCKKLDDNRFKTLPYICSEPQNIDKLFLCFLKSMDKNPIKNTKVWVFCKNSFFSIYMGFPLIILPRELAFLPLCVC